MTSSEQISTEHVEGVRRYLAALLPPEAAEAALREALDQARYWRDSELEDVLVHAHTSLRARMNISARTEAAVLVRQTGIGASTAGEIVGIPAEDVTEVVEEPAAEERAVEEPAAEERVVEEPAAEGDAVDPVIAARTEPMASPTADPIGRPKPGRARRRLPRTAKLGAPPEAIGEELRRHLRREDLDGHRYARSTRLTLVGTALGVFLLFLASVAASGLIA